MEPSRRGQGLYLLEGGDLPGPWKLGAGMGWGVLDRLSEHIGALRFFIVLLMLFGSILSPFSFQTWLQKIYQKIHFLEFFLELIFLQKQTSEIDSTRKNLSIFRLALGRVKGPRVGPITE